MDGVGVSYINGPETVNGLTSGTDMFFDYANFQGFITNGLSWNPRNDMLLKTTLGTGYHQAKVDADIRSYISKKFAPGFTEKYPFLTPDSYYVFEPESVIKEDALNITAQGRIDYDWSLGEGLVFAAGVQEMFNNFIDTGDFNLQMEGWFNDLGDSDKQRIREELNPPYPASPLPQSFYDTLRVIYPTSYTSRVDNKLFSTSAYSLMEYSRPDNPFGVELGMRLDHFYITGKGFSASTTPVFNPRLNIDFNAFKSDGLIQSLGFSAGTGLFSSINDMIVMVDERYDLDGARPARSWTTVLGTKLDFTGGFSFNIEGYYKYVFDRAYIPFTTGPGDIDPHPYTDGEGKIWGFDLMLQKHQSRFWDGWISYTFNWARYRDPNGGGGSGFSGGTRGDDWYFPSYHRFHNLNLVLNIKPIPAINFYTRFGFASGTQLAKIVGPITSYPVYVLAEGGNNFFIERYLRATELDENNRTTPSLPLDFKFSILGSNATGRARYEVYVALENALALLYTAQGNTTFNSYTGEEDTGSNSASYELPIPIPSFGFKLSY
jgi:hypothetical protein